MINSLRLIGHSEPIYLLDTGLTPQQREILAPEASLLPSPAGESTMLKAVAPLRHPAEVSVLIDADVIVTRPLKDLIDQASDRKVIAFENDVDRFVPEWGELVGRGDARRLPYVAAGLLFLSVLE
jgi:hypothetical protein